MKLFFFYTCFLWMVLSWNVIDASSMPSETKPKKNCTYNDVSCVTKAINVLYPIVVAGKAGVAEPADPLTMETVSVNMTDLKYVGENGTLTGLLACVVQKLALIPENGTYTFIIACPKLNIEVSNCATNARVSGRQIVGSGGPSKISYFNNILQFTGYYSSFFDADYQQYHRIETFILKLSTEKLYFIFPGLVYGDQVLYYKPVSQEDIRKYGEMIAENLMASFMPKFQSNYNKMLAIESIESTYVI